MQPRSAQVLSVQGLERREQDVLEERISNPGKNAPRPEEKRCLQDTLGEQKSPHSLSVHNLQASWGCNE